MVYTDYTRVNVSVHSAYKLCTGSTFMHCAYRLYVYMYTYTYMYTRIHVCAYTCVCVYTYISASKTINEHITLLFAAEC